EASEDDDGVLDKLSLELSCNVLWVKVKKVMRGYSIGVEALVDIRQVIKVDAKLESRFWFCMSNTAYSKYGYGVLKVSDGYGVFISWIWRIHKVVDDVGANDDFKSGAWVSATNYVTATG
nr:hypothetical protein [Tanacetum cinerariifolium]